MIRVAVSIPVLTFAITPAAAADCAVRDTIVSLSDMVLEQHTTLSRLEARNVGVEAAYLKIRYKPDFAPHALDVIDGLVAANVHKSRELGFAWHLHHYQSAQMTANWLGGEDAFANAALTSPTTIRALVLNRDEDMLVRLLNRLPADSQIAKIHTIYGALIDLPDEDKLRIVGATLSAGPLDLRTAMLATMRDRTRWADFASGAPREEVERATRLWRDLPIFVGNPRLPRATGNQPVDPAADAAYESVLAVATMAPQLDLLATYLNMSGQVAETQKAALALKAAIGDGTIRQRGAFDAAWLQVYQALRSALANDPSVDNILRSITPGRRPQRATAAEVLDWIIALDALGPYLRGETNDVPAAPHGPGRTLDENWNDWVALAEMARNIPLMLNADGDKSSLAMAAELLFAAGKMDALQALMGRATPSFTSVTLAADFAQRLDRQCESYLWHQAEALLLGGTPIYKFDDPLPQEAAEPSGKGSAKN